MLFYPAVKKAGCADRSCGVKVSLYGLKRRIREERARRLLSQFGLADTGKKPFKAYSKGMKRKLTIAAGIIHRPKVLFIGFPWPVVFF